MKWILHQDCRQCWVFNVLIQYFRLYIYVLHTVHRPGLLFVHSCRPDKIRASLSAIVWWSKMSLNCTLIWTVLCSELYSEMYLELYSEMHADTQICTRILCTSPVWHIIFICKKSTYERICSKICQKDHRIQCSMPQSFNTHNVFSTG